MNDLGALEESNQDKQHEYSIVSGDRISDPMGERRSCGCFLVDDRRLVGIRGAIAVDISRIYNPSFLYILRYIFWFLKGFFDFLVFVQYIFARLNRWSS